MEYTVKNYTRDQICIIAIKPHAGDLPDVPAVPEQKHAGRPAHWQDVPRRCRRTGPQLGGVK